MANGCLTWLETKLPCSDVEKVDNAIKTMTQIYEESKDCLSDGAKEIFFIISYGEKKKTIGMHK